MPKSRGRENKNSQGYWRTDEWKCETGRPSQQKSREIVAARVIRYEKSTQSSIVPGSQSWIEVNYSVKWTENETRRLW